MGMLRTCDHDGCSTLTLGRLCIDHEPPAVEKVFPRGRPFVPTERTPAALRELPPFATTAVELAPTAAFL